MLPTTPTDADLQRAMGRLGIDRHTVRAVLLLPLVQVAWADGRVQPAERRLISEIAARYGLEPHEAEVVQQWLARRPTAESFALARELLLVLWARDRDRGAAPDSLDGVLRMCHAVARVAGGLFGLAFTVDRRERELLEELARTLHLGPRLTPEAQEGLLGNDEPTVLLQAVDLAAIEPQPVPAPSDRFAAPPSVPPAAQLGPHPTLTPPPERFDSATVPLHSLRAAIDEEDDTELDLPVLPHPYDAYVLDDDDG